MSVSRRSFLVSAASTAGAFFIPARSVFGQAVTGLASTQFRFAIVGVGGMGWATREMIASAGGVCTAAADVDPTPLKDLQGVLPGIPVFRDYREMLAKHAKDFDAVAIATPDHTHAKIALDCLAAGKHVYIQKPLAHTVEECELLLAAQKRTGLCVQMGNQGHPGVKRYEALRDGNAWGEITAVESWSDRPGAYWVQGMKEFPVAEPLPANWSKNDWDVWCGPSPDRGYSPAYHPARWRGWWDYGCGPIGDMAVHNADPAFWSLGLGLPVSVKGDTCGFGPVTCAFPFKSVIEMTFAPQPRFPKGLTFTWRDGGLRPERPQGAHPALNIPDNGLIVKGTELTTLGASHASPPLVVAAAGHDWNADTKTAQRDWGRKLRGIALYDHQKEWIDACKAGKPEACGSALSYAAPLTEALLIGCIALRFPGRALAFDPVAKRFTDCEEANAFLRAPERGVWKFDRT